MIVFERRASTVLYNLLTSRQDKATFLLPANVCPVVPLTFLKAGQPFEFVDISPHTMCISEEILLDHLRKFPNKYGGLLFVRTYGAIFDTTDLFREVKTTLSNCLIIDDRCLCPPLFPKSPPAYTDALLFSTGYAKYVDIGTGGYGVLAEGVPYRSSQLKYEPEALDRIIAGYKVALNQHIPYLYSDSHWLDTRSPEFYWMNYQEQVENERAHIAQIKLEINALYATRFPQEIQLDIAYQEWRFNLCVRDKMILLKTIQEAGFFASSHYDSLAGVFSKGDAYYAQQLHNCVINLFNDRYFSLENAWHLTEVLLSHIDLLQPPKKQL